MRAGVDSWHACPDQAVTATAILPHTTEPRLPQVVSAGKWERGEPCKRQLQWARIHQRACAHQRAHAHERACTLSGCQAEQPHQAAQKGPDSVWPGALCAQLVLPGHYARLCQTPRCALSWALTMYRSGCARLQHVVPKAHGTPLKRFRCCAWAGPC